jgi:hypothetical protein
MICVEQVGPAHNMMQQLLCRSIPTTRGVLRQRDSSWPPIPEPRYAREQGTCLEGPAGQTNELLPPDGEGRARARGSPRVGASVRTL